MKLYINLLLLLCVSLVMSCSKDNPDRPTLTEKDKILMNYPWKMVKVTDLSGKTISPNQLNVQTQYIPMLEINFVVGNKVFAKDAALQVQNGGTWYLKENNQVLDIDIVGFKGKFGVFELSNPSMKLQSTMPVNGIDQQTIMVFEPVIN